MQEISKKTLLEEFGIDLPKGRYKIIYENNFYKIYKIHDSTSGCILGGKKTKDGELENTGFTKYMVDLLNQYGGKAKLIIK